MFFFAGVVKISQSNLPRIDESMKAYFENIDNKPPVKASDDFKARMKEKFK